MAFEWLKAPLTQGYGPTDTKLDGPYKGSANFNKGYDYGVPVGTPIDGLVDGVVIAAGDQGDGWGISVKVRDAQGNVHNYGHLSSANVKVGDQVSRGQVVGASGNTGKSTGPHLSYDVSNSSGEFFDPAEFVGGIALQEEPEEEPWMGEADQLDLLLEEILADKPDKTDPAFQFDDDGDGVATFDPIAYGQALKDWTQTVTDVSSAAKQIKMASYGLTELPDGTMIALGDLPPDQAKAIDDANYNVYAGLLNKFGLTDYDLRVNRTKDNNDVTNSDFANKMKELEGSLAYDDLNLASAKANIDRSLSGLAESRNRADLINDSVKMQQQWGTSGGKTNYSLLDIAPGLFKASGSNIDPSLISINYSGVADNDPMSIMEKYDKALGVGGPLPSVPSLITQPGGIPKSPTLSPITTPLPSLLAPKPPSPVQSKSLTSILSQNPFAGMP